MIEEYNKIMEIGIEGTLKSPQYLIALIRLYSKIYLGGAQCSTCEKSCRKYFEQLKKDGMTKVEQLEAIKKRTCKPAFKGLVFSPKAGHINPELITDELAEFYLLNDILKESHFEILPVNYLNNSKVKIQEVDINQESTDIEVKENKHISKTKKK